MKIIIFLLVIFSFSSNSQGRESPICENPLASKISNSVCLFSKPLLIGASVTQGFGANPGGPSSIIAKRLSPGAEITNIAKGGASSVSSLKDHTVPLERPSVVMGLDLFFWDAARKSCDDSFVEKTKSFLKLYQDLNIPMILGKLPKNQKFPSGYNVLNSSECTDKINSLLDAECTLEKNCLLYDPKECLVQMEAEANQRFPKGKEEQRDAYLKEMFVDKLHSSVKGNKFCADVFIAGKTYQQLECLTNK